MATTSEIAYCAFATAIPYPTTLAARVVSIRLHCGAPLELGAIAGGDSTYQDDILRIEQAVHSVIDVRLRDRPFNLMLRLFHGRADAAEENVCQRPVHRDALSPEEREYITLDQIVSSAHTMMYERMEPLTPISDPTVVSRGLSSMKPMMRR